MPHIFYPSCIVKRGNRAQYNTIATGYAYCELQLCNNKVIIDHINVDNIIDRRAGQNGEATPRGSNGKR
jgi:hypothetical protein